MGSDDNHPLNLNLDKL